MTTVAGGGARQGRANPVASMIGVGVSTLVLAMLILGVVVYRVYHVRRQRTEMDARQQQATVVHMSRVEVFGELAGALAHEIKTPLAAIMNDARAAQHFLEVSGPGLRDARECIAAIESNVQRAHDVILQMRNALRSEPGARSLRDLSSIVRDSVQLLQREARDRGAEFGLLLARRPLQVEVNPVQLQQVLVNLLLNGLDAIAEQPPERRRVVVRTHASGGWAEGEVLDRGCGVPDKHRPHLFEPFYTTKPTGLGMGLSISRAIAELYGGRILMESAEGVGSVFRLILPLARQNQVAPTEGI